MDGNSRTGWTRFRSPYLATSKEKLREHYSVTTEHNKDKEKGGDPDAFFRFARHMERRVPKPASAVTLQGQWVRPRAPPALLHNDSRASEH